MARQQTVTNTKYNRALDSDFITVGAYSPILNIGNAMENARTIIKDIHSSRELMDCDLVVTPELSLTGYTCQDMFFNKDVLDGVGIAINYLADNLEPGKLLCVGAPMRLNHKLYNCSILLSSKGIINVTPKKYIANYAEFYEDRWFSSYDDEHPMDLQGFGHNIVNIDDGIHVDYVIGSELCEDLWAPDAVSTHLALAGATVIINNSASNETVGKARFRRDLVKMQSAKTISAYIYCSAGMSESTQDVVFGGHNIIAENGRILAESDLFDLETKGLVVATIDLGALVHDRMLNKTFSNSRPTMHVGGILNHLVPRTRPRDRVYRSITVTPFVPSGRENSKLRCREIFDMQVAGLASRLIRTRSKHVVIGVSGGLDSTLALLVAHAAVEKAHMPEDSVLGITMPCFGTTSRTKDNAIKLMEKLGCKMMEINISESVEQHLKDIGLDKNDRSVAFENAQARERTQVLMDVANKEGGFVLGTGDMSELALGWCTYNGDHMSMYNTNGSIPKTLVRMMVGTIGEWIMAGKDGGYDVIKDIIDTPVSPELLPPKDNGEIAQLTEDSVGPYVFNDFFMYYHIRYGFEREKILGLLEIACKQEDMDFSKAEYWLDKFYSRFYRAQFKRNVCPDGVKVGSVSLNPRGDWRCPSEFDGGTHTALRYAQ